MVVKVNYGQQEGKLSLLVDYGRGPSLLGRDWLSSLQLNWQEIHSLHSCSLLEVLDKHVVYTQLFPVRSIRQTCSIL